MRIVFTLQGAFAVAAEHLRADGVGVPEGGAAKVPLSGRRSPARGGQQTGPVRALHIRAREHEPEALRAALAARRLRLSRVPLLVYVRSWHFSLWF